MNTALTVAALSALVIALCVSIIGLYGAVLLLCRWTLRLPMNISALTAAAPAVPFVGRGGSCASAEVVKAGGFFWLNEAAFLKDFANGLELARARALHAAQGPAADALATAKTATAAWRVMSRVHSVIRDVARG
jgi:hypothetical protein